LLHVPRHQLTFPKNKNLSGSKRQVNIAELALIFQNFLLPELAPGLEVGDWRLEIRGAPLTSNF
jgi:hypothetical protein